MASTTKMPRDISAILILVLSINVLISGLPIGETNDGNRDDETFQHYGDDVLQRNGNLGADTAGGVAQVAGNLPLMAGPVIPGGGTGNLYPNNMPPPPGAVNNPAPQVAAPSNGNMFPDNMPPPPPGAFNEEEPQAEQVAAPSNGNMFPNNMPPPPPGAFNDEAPQAEQVAAPSNGNMFNNMPPPPPDALNDEGPQLAAPNNGNMFPGNMPPPPPGAFNDEAPPLGQVAAPVNNNILAANIPSGAVNDEAPQQEQVAAPKNGNMFPNNMPPPPSGAFNSGVAALPVEEAAPQENLNQETSVEQPANAAVPPFQGMFPPNMPPPPPGAFNAPPPSPRLKEKKPISPSLPSDGDPVEPVYVSGLNVPSAAILPASDQNPYIDPNQVPSLPSNQQNVPSVNQSNDTTYISNNQNTAESQESGSLQAIGPDTVNTPQGESAPYNPDALPESTNDAALQSKNPYPDDTYRPNETPVNNDYPGNNPAPGDQIISNQPIATDTSSSESETQSSEEYDPDSGRESWDSTSDYSFMEWFDSSMEETDNTIGSGGIDDDDDDEDEYENFWEIVSSSSESYSDLDWILDSNGDSFQDFGEEGNDVDEDDYFGADSNEEGYFGGDGDDEERGQEGDEGQHFTLPEGYIDALEREDELYRTGGTRLIMYCIPAIIMTVLVLLAWKNYRGKIRVVGVPSGDIKSYDWKSERKSEEHAPMLEDQDEREY